MNEPTVTGNNGSLCGNPNVENYLHEAGLVKDAPSGNIYYDGNGSRLTNLGVHEHWNNGQDKQYGRNLGKAEGIELIPLTSQKDEQEPEQKAKTLVAYFSCTDTTKTLAEYAAEILDADCYRILPEAPYTAEDLAYYTNGRADQEQNDPSARPAISGNVEAMEQYDTIVLGYPIWHGQAPRIISTFLESYDFSGKTIVPFCTSHSSGIGSSASNLHALCPDSVKWEDGKRFAAGTSKEEIEKWLTETGIRIPTHSHTLQTNVGKAGIDQNGYIRETCTVCGQMVNEKEISAVKSIRLSKTSYVYNGKTRKPFVTVTDKKNKKLKEGTDYTIIYPANMKNAGIYTVKIVFQGNYGGTEEQAFQIIPKNTSIVKLISGKKKFTVKWKKQTKQTTGYEIAYSVSSKFPKKKTGTIRIGKSNTISKTVSKLKANKKYYVRIRTYKTVKVQGKQKKIYSGWSKAKTVKTKR